MRRLFTREELLEAEVERLTRQVTTLNKKNAKQRRIISQKDATINKLRAEKQAREDRQYYINVPLKGKKRR